MLIQLGNSSVVAPVVFLSTLAGLILSLALAGRDARRATPDIRRRLRRRMTWAVAAGVAVGVLNVVLLNSGAFAGEAVFFVLGIVVPVVLALVVYLANRTRLGPLAGRPAWALLFAATLSLWLAVLLYIYG